MDRGIILPRRHPAPAPHRRPTRADRGSSGQPCTAEGADRPKIPALKMPLRAASSTSGASLPCQEHSHNSCPASPLSLDKNSAGNPQDVTKHHLQTLHESVSCPTECCRAGEQLPLHAQSLNPIYDMIIILCNMNTSSSRSSCVIFQNSHTTREGRGAQGAPGSHPTLHTQREFYLQCFQSLSTILKINLLEKAFKGL